MKALRWLLVAAAVAVAAVVVLRGSRGPAAPPPAADAPPAAAPHGGGPVAFGVLPTVEDRFVNEPCNVVTGGALASAGPFLATVTKAYPGAIGIAMGDLTLAPGDLGRHTAGFLYGEMMPYLGVAFVAAGEGELGLGAEYLRGMFGGDASPSLLCANASGPDGRPVLRGWALLESSDRGVAIVAVAGESLREDIERRGSDVRLAPPREAAEKALAEARAQARAIGRSIEVVAMLVHGTVDEAEAVVRGVAGATFAVAAHGDVLPDVEPRRVEGVPVLYGGRGVRFGWRVLSVPEFAGVEPFLARLGDHLLAQGKAGEKTLEFLRGELTGSLFGEFARAKGGRPPDPRGAYVGAARCQQCHPEQCSAHSATRHALVPEPILGSDHAGSSQCAPCHVTGAWWETGWAGPGDRSELASVSCEACHGPASAHVENPETGWGRVAWSRCLECHLPDRSPGFDPAAAWKTGGHGGR